MPEITAALVKELRERTNEAMMDCKRALVATNGDIEAAIKAMRNEGKAKAVKKASRTAAEGTIVALNAKDGKKALLIEVNCETDFVAREGKFREFATQSANHAITKNIKSIEDLQKETEDARLELVGQLGENISVRRLALHEVSEGVVGTYAHGDANGVRIAALVVLAKGDESLARDLAMQVAAMNPQYLTPQDVPKERLAEEKAIFEKQTREEGKPEAMIEKIVDGKLKKFANEISLTGQPFVKDPSKTVEALLKESKAEVKSFVRFEVGEGIEKKEDNFVQEVMAQVRGE